MGRWFRRLLEIKGDAMKKLPWWAAPVLAATLVGTSGAPTQAEGLEVVEGKAFDSGFVKDFYLEGNAIPTQKRNAVMVKTTGGKRMLFALLDTSGYGADIQAKYTGMAIVEEKVSLGAITLGVGAYGFGVKTANPPGDEPATLLFYDVAGQNVGEATVPYDAELAGPVPLQLVTEGGKAMLYLGRYGVEIH
jgi:hypothetical protein